MDAAQFSNKIKINIHMAQKLKKKNLKFHCQMMRQNQLMKALLEEGRWN
jgi:hypothetical protein